MDVIESYNKRHKLSHHAFMRARQRHIKYVPRRIKKEAKIIASNSIKDCYKLISNHVCIVYSTSNHVILTMYKVKK